MIVVKKEKNADLQNITKLSNNATFTFYLYCIYTQKKNIMIFIKFKCKM